MSGPTPDQPMMGMAVITFRFFVLTVEYVDTRMPASHGRGNPALGGTSGWHAGADRYSNQGPGGDTQQRSARQRKRPATGKPPYPRHPRSLGLNLIPVPRPLRRQCVANHTMSSQNVSCDT